MTDKEQRHDVVDLDRDLIDEETVRNLLVSLGYPNPSPEAIEQTLLEAQQTLKQQRLSEMQNQATEEYIEDDEDHHHSSSHADPDRRKGIEADPHSHNFAHVSNQQFASENYPPYWADELAENRAHDQSQSEAHTASTPAGATAHTPISAARHKASHAVAAQKKSNTSTKKISFSHEQTGEFSSTSSRPSSRQNDPYFRRTKEPVHLQHFEPYLRMMAKDSSKASGAPIFDIPSQQPRREDWQRQSGEMSSTPRVTQQSKRTSEPRPSSERRAPTQAEVHRCNVIYTFTGNPKYRCTVMTPRGASTTIAKHTDPVSRGAEMRKAWQHDNFLTQKGRKEERWQVRRSMLSWEAQ